MGLEEEEEEEKKEWREEVRKLALDTSNRTKLPTAECVNINVVLDKAASHARAHTHRVNLHSDADESSFYALTENGRANQQKWGDDERWGFFLFPMMHFSQLRENIAGHSNNIPVSHLLSVCGCSCKAAVSLKACCVFNTAGF